MKKSILLFMLLALAFSSCTRKPWRKTDNGVIINNGEKAIALEVIRPWIIHVFASEDLVVPEKESYYSGQIQA
ncbi:MAG: hypothetical protein U0T82_09775 [Bacteroidales bacterium]